MSTNVPAEDARRPDWVGQRAIAWVIDEAPVPVDLFPTLTVIARRCDENGQGSFQSKQTLAEKTGKSEDQAHRDVKELLKLGLIRLGDQSLPGKYGIKPGQWPTVYDVALEKKGPKPSRRSKNPTGRKKPGEVEPEETPRMDATPGMDAGGGMEAPGTPGMDATGTPRMDATQRKPLNNPLNNPSLSGDLPSVPAPRDPGEEDRERDGSTSSSTPNLPVQQRLVIKHGCAQHLAQLVVEYIEATNTIDGLGWWITADRNGSLAVQVQAGIAANTPSAGDQAPQSNTRCPEHPNYPADTCGPCRSDRIARGNEQPRTSQRGQVTPRVNVPEGTHTAAWERRRQQHTSAGERKYLRAQAIGAELDAELGIRRQPGQHHPYRNPADQSAHDPWQPNAHLILDAEPEATP